MAAGFRFPFGRRQEAKVADDGTIISAPAAETDEAPARALRAGPYRLDEQLGAGGESLVWQATHEGTGKTAVVKVQRGNVRPERLRREVAVLYALQMAKTPNVVRLLPAGDGEDVGHLPGTLRSRGGDELLYCALELLPCKSGSNLINGVLDPREPRRLNRRDTLEVCDALRATLRVMHLDFQMIHNDLKPENIVAWRDARDGRLRVRLYDFGHAALLMPDPRGGAPCITPEPAYRYVYDYGTLAFMAPERWHGQAAYEPAGQAPGADGAARLAIVDDRADQWSFAAVVFELLNARRLVRPAANTKEHFRRTIVDGTYIAALREARLDERVKRCLYRALAPDPADRFLGSASVSGLDFLCRDLEAALA